MKNRTRFNPDEETVAVAVQKAQEWAATDQDNYQNSRRAERAEWRALNVLAAHLERRSQHGLGSIGDLGDWTLTDLIAKHDEVHRAGAAFVVCRGDVS